MQGKEQEAKTRLHLIAKLRIRVAIVPINLYAFMSSCLDKWVSLNPPEKKSALLAVSKEIAISYF
jgi:hypothetical protein